MVLMRVYLHSNQKGNQIGKKCDTVFKQLKLYMIFVQKTFFEMYLQIALIMKTI